MLDLSAVKETPFGNLIKDLHCSEFLRSIFKVDEYGGSTYNGGKHTLYLRTHDADDLFSFLELVDEVYAEQNKFEKGFAILCHKVVAYIDKELRE